ncbi:MAG: L-seryl-tRNA(Sec) selenium transferase [Deltaproteobacteria bacterium ADurb.Bin022]|nr:MAG: L-seryl-tRNA(Sec) selenium transferase [Deltaproteobacteria bacterium ADurb.Bin022]
MHYLNTSAAPKKLRALKALTEPVADVKKRAEKLIEKLQNENFDQLKFSIREDFAAAGGGSLPTQQIPTVLVAVNNKNMTATRMEEKLRKLEMPIIARVDKDEILFDLRTVAEDEFTFIIEGLKQIIT